MLKIIDVRFFYFFSFIFILPVVFLVNGKSRKASIGLYRKGFKYGKLKSLRLAYLNHYNFAKVVIDKFAMFAGQSFKIDIEGIELFDSLNDQQGGFILLSSHVGNYELAGYSLKSEKKLINVLVFGGEKSSVMENRLKMFSRNNIKMIPTGDGMDYLFDIDNALNHGEIIGMPGDRIFGSRKVFSTDFLEKKAGFPQGPFSLAFLKQVPVLFIAALKTGNKNYKIILKPLQTDYSSPKQQVIEELGERYVKELEAIVKSYPLQWFNFFDFWTR